MAVHDFSAAVEINDFINAPEVGAVLLGQSWMPVEKGSFEVIHNDFLADGEWFRFVWTAEKKNVVGRMSSLNALVTEGVEY